MNRRAAKIATAALSVAIVLGTISAGALAGKHQKSSSLKAATNVPVTELKWQETPIGVLASPVAGDFTMGGHVTYLKFPAGAKPPAHTHSADYTGIVLFGNMRHEVKGAPETQRSLPPGSYWSIPANVEHVSECLPGTECVAVLMQNEKFDFLPTVKK